MNRIDQLPIGFAVFWGTHAPGSLATGRLAGGAQAIAMLMRRMGLEALYRKPRTTQR